MTGVGQFVAIVKNRLKRIQYRPPPDQFRHLHWHDPRPGILVPLSMKSPVSGYFGVLSALVHCTVGDVLCLLRPRHVRIPALVGG
ncbi:hypothetical protein [Dactylosporangium darangshiense]|uniref:hypothetical protein n=1 Tax=Dactylosporangium darangshiense TaxID=579108 RepID=UPI0031EC01E0